MTNLDPSYEVSNTCLITGGNGYLGKHIYQHLSHLNYKISTLGKKNNNTFVYDLSTQVPILNRSFKTVVHCAGRAHSFPQTKEQEQAFFDVNVTGTSNLLSALEAAPTLPSHFVFMSSVSVYGLNKGIDINEEEPLQSSYPYGKSKIEAEQVIISWCKRHGVTCLILRLPLLAGKNPPGNLRVMIEGIKKGYYFNLSKKSVRKSIVMADDVAKIIPKSLNMSGIFNLTDGYHPSFQELAVLIAGQVNRPLPKSFPSWMSRVLMFLVKKFGFLSPINAYKFQKLTSSLTFDDSKARETIGWNPTPVLSAFKIK